MDLGLALTAFSFTAALAATLWLSSNKRSLAFYAVLLLVLLVLLGAPSVAGFALALAYRYRAARLSRGAIAPQQKV